MFLDNVEEITALIFLCINVFLCPVLSLFVYDRIKVDQPLSIDKLHPFVKYIVFLTSAVFMSRMLAIIVNVIASYTIELHSLSYMIISLLFSIISPLIIKITLVHFDIEMSISRNNEK